MLINQPVHEYARALASKQPAPGGGSAAALSGVLGTGLMSMCLHLTLGKAEFANQEEFLQERLQTLTGIQNRLEELVDQDAAVFFKLMDTYRLPKATAEEKEIRTTAIQSALRQAAATPLAIAEMALQALETGRTLLGKINSQIVSDLAVGTRLCQAAAESALLNVAINLPLIKDDKAAKELTESLSLTRKQADAVASEILHTIYTQEPFTIMNR